MKPASGSPASNGSGDAEAVAEAYGDAETGVGPIRSKGPALVEFSEEGPGDDLPGEDSTAAMRLKRSTLAVSFRTISTLATRRRSSNTRKTRQPSNSF